MIFIKGRAKNGPALFVIHISIGICKINRYVGKQEINPQF